MDFQMKQILSILQTMEQSFIHMKDDIQQEQFANVYPVFISVVEGLQAIYPVLLKLPNPSLHKQLSQYEDTIVQFSNLLEAQQSTQLLSLVQFQLLPQLQTIQKQIDKEEVEERSNISIGLYYGNAHPVEVYRKERLIAMIDEAKKQNASLYMFTSSDLNMDTEKVQARTSVEDETIVEIGLPDVIINIFPKLDYAQDEEEQWLRQRVPFTTFPVGNKITLPSRLLKESNYGHLFIPFVGVTDFEKVIQFFKQYKKGVFKKIAAARGENIFFVEQKSKNRFVVEVDKKPIIMNMEGFRNWVTDYLITDHYILQQFKQFKTRDGRPYDIRAHVQKNGEGMWTLTKIYPRIGTNKGILSNISRGGSTEELGSFLREQFTEERIDYYLEKLPSLSLEVAHAVDAVYNHSIDELGLDLAIDDTGRIWMHEANGGPQTTYHEEERAVNTIAYAKYLAKNRMFLTNPLQTYTGFDDQFKYEPTTDLPIIDLDDRVVIGLLYEGRFTNEKFREACAITATYANCNFYTFRAKDIDYENKVIRAQFYDQFEWKEKVVRYPDVIYDRLRAKGTSMYNLVYHEFKHLPFTHTIDFEELDKLNIQKQLDKIDELQPYLIPTIELTTDTDLSQFIETHGTIILKPIHGSFAMGIIKLEKIGNRYMWTEDEQLDYSWHQLTRQLEKRNMYNRYFAQKYVESKAKDGTPIDVRMHMIKDAQDPNKWVVAKEYVRVSDGGFKINTVQYASGRAFSGTMTYIHRYITKNFPEKAKELEEKIYDFAQLISLKFDEIHNGQVGEQALDIAITTKGEIYLLEINANRPGVYGYEYEIARYMIPYALQLKNNGE